MTNEYTSANRALWNLRTSLHLDSDFYDVESFRDGRSTLCGIEPVELGDVTGKSILHLQCHFGLDTLSLCRLGASVTGVDFSDAAIDAAKSLAEEVDLPAKFVCCDLFELTEHLDQEFDIVFTSFGVLGWLSDIQRWAETVQHFLKPNGFLYLLEFDRRFVQMEAGVITYDYFHSESPDEEIVETTYADCKSHAPMKEYWWNHTMSEIVSAILKSGMQITLFNEFPYSAYKIDESMVESSPGKWVDQNLREKISYMFSVKAHNSADRVVPYGTA